MLHWRCPQVTTRVQKARHLRLPMRAKVLLACGATHPPTPRTCGANHPPAPWLMRHLQKRTGGGVLLRPGHPGALQRHVQAGPEALPCGWSARARWRDGAASYFKAARLRRNFRLPGLHPRLPESHFRILEFHFRLPEVPGARAGGFAALDLGPSTLNLRPAPPLNCHHNTHASARARVPCAPPWFPLPEKG